MLNSTEVKIYRLCHHSFYGLSVIHAAIIMDLTPRRIEQILEGMEVKASQLFPILTPVQARNYHLYVDEGWTLREIMEHTGQDFRRVSESILAAIAKGMPPPSKKNRLLRYDETMDANVKERF